MLTVTNLLTNECCFLFSSFGYFLHYRKDQSYRLYAVGGRDGSSCLRSVECFDPHTNKWSLCAPMTKRRGGVGVTTCNGFLYAVGGHDAPTSNPTSSRFDCVERLVSISLKLDSSTWRQLPAFALASTLNWIRE